MASSQSEDFQSEIANPCWVEGMKLKLSCSALAIGSVSVCLTTISERRGELAGNEHQEKKPRTVSGLNRGISQCVYLVSDALSGRLSLGPRVSVGRQILLILHRHCQEPRLL